MMEPGHNPSIFDVDRLHDVPAANGDWRYVQCPPGPLEDARAWIIARRGAIGHSYAIRDDLEGMESVLEWIGGLESPQGEVGLGVSRAVIARFGDLRYHTDRLNPYPGLNACLFLRRSANGGELILETDLGPMGFTCKDGMALIFDGSRLHGVTKVQHVTPGGYRASINFYCPLGVS